MKKTELSRLKTVIESDRLSMTGENTALIVKDITAVLEDYFALSGEPELKIEKLRISPDYFRYGDGNQIFFHFAERLTRKSCSELQK